MKQHTLKCHPSRSEWDGAGPGRKGEDVRVPLPFLEATDRDAPAQALRKQGRQWESGAQDRGGQETVAFPSVLH